MTFKHNVSNWLIASGRLGWEPAPAKLGRLCKVTAGQRDTGERLSQTWEGPQAQGSKPAKTGTCGAESQRAARVPGKGEPLSCGEITQASQEGNVRAQEGGKKGNGRAKATSGRNQLSFATSQNEMEEAIMLGASARPLRMWRARCTGEMLKDGPEVLMWIKGRSRLVPREQEGQLTAPSRIQSLMNQLQGLRGMYAITSP